MKIPPLARFLKDLVYGGFESFGRYYSIYRAYVVDNVDPEGFQRLRVLVPQISTFPYQQWAYPRNVFSGVTAKDERYGSQLLPQKGDIVWVEFEMGNPEVPIWSLGHPGKNDKALDEELTDPNSYWLKTPKGNLVIINDTKSTIRVLLKDTGESRIFQLTPDAASIVHKKISLGKEGESSQKAVLGNKHNDHEDKTLEYITQLKVMTSMGPSSVPTNAADFAQQRSKLNDILSDVVTLE